MRKISTLNLDRTWRWELNQKLWFISLVSMVVQAAFLYKPGTPYYWWHLQHQHGALSQKSLNKKIIPKVLMQTKMMKAYFPAEAFVSCWLCFILCWWNSNYNTNGQADTVMIMWPIKWLPFVHHIEKMTYETLKNKYPPLK